MKKLLYSLSMLVCLLGVSVNAWASGSQTFHATSAEPAKGLVYANNSASANPAISDYTSPSAAAQVGTNRKEGMAFASYAWAMPARGYNFAGWEASTNGNTAPSGQTYNKIKPATNTGSGDKVTTTVPRMQTHHGWTMATFGAATGYNVVYKQPEGGNYTVKYEYNIVNDSTKKFTTGSETLELTPTSGDKQPTDPRDASDHKTYTADKITLTATEGNFIAWYKNGVELSKSNPYTEYSADAAAEISALYQYIVLGEAAGELTVNAKAMGAYNRTIYVYYSQKIGTWNASDFSISPMNPDGADVSNEYGSIEFGAISIDETNNRLVIPYTYTATDWGGLATDVTIVPPSGAGTGSYFSIACSAEEIVDYEACIEESGVRTYTGALAAMMTQANTMTNKPTVKLMNPVTITTPLSFTKSMTFDVNGKVLTASCASAFSIDAASIDVKIIDGSFTQVGEIHTSYASTDPVSVVTFTQAAKLTMNGGTLSSTNTSSGRAYGIWVQNGSVFYMTDGKLTVSSATGEARGVQVMTGCYATINGGSISVSGTGQVYGFNSQATSNLTGTTIEATTTGSNACGVFVNGGTTTLTETSVTLTAGATNGYGAYVKAGRLNVNGGTIDAKAATSGAYGVHIDAGATAMLQQNVVVTAEATGASGTKVFGVDNLGTVSLSNILVTATSPTNNATAVNSATSAVSTTIEGGTYTANVETGTVYGLHHQYGTLTVDGGTFKGILKTSGANAYGARFAADGTVSNVTILGETRGTGATAYGVVGGVANKTITLTNCTITGQSNTSKAYAIYSRANVSAIGCTLTATTKGADLAYGIYAEAGTNNLTGCNATVKAETVSAYGAYHKAGSLLIDGGEYEVQAKQSLASAEQSAYAYGLYNVSGQISSVQNATFRVTSGNSTFSKDLFGAYINGTLNSTGATYSAEAKLQAYGILGNTASTLNLSGNTISSRTTNGATSYGIYAKKNFTIEGDVVSAIGNATGVYAMFFDASTSYGNVLGGKFSAQGNGTNGYGALNAAGTVGKVKLKGGVYKTTVNLQKYTETGYQIYHLDETHPDYAEGYRYIIATENPSPYVCRIVNGAYYATLEEALQYTQDHEGTFTIVMTQSYTLPAGDYVLPANATLIVPRKFGQTTITETPTANNPDPAQPDKRNTVGLREEFLRLTIARDAHINVGGRIGVSGDVYCQESGYISYNNSPYGHIYMEEGGLIQLNEGARLYAWGFISGSGNIKVKNNAEVHEMFQIGDMQTVGHLADGFYDNSYGHFLINQYCIHNIEVPTTYYYNSRLICAMYNYYKGTNTYQGGYNILVVGTTGALFEVTTEDESSWVRKSYDAAHDLQVWDVNSSAQLGSIEMTVANQKINSLDYILPITSNMKIHILDGEFKITQSTEFLPGSSLEIDKTASLTINETYKNSSKQTKNLKVYVFDKDQWPLTTATCSPVYSPSWPNGTKPSRTAGDAALNVHGNINIEGSLYTSNKGAETSKTDGANIFSNNADAGTISFVNAASSTSTTIDIITGVSSSAIVTKTITMDPALLKNGNGSFTETSGTAASHSFAYMNNEWTQTYTNGCFEVVGDKVYAKPSGYVQLKKTAMGDDGLEGVEEDDHTYLTIDDKLLILMIGCQWWEVEATSDPSVFECKKPGYEGFYYYDNSDPDPDERMWKLKTVNVKFYSKEEGEGDAVLHTVVTDFNGRPDPSVIPSNPTKATTTGFTYQFYGWKSSETGTTYKWTDPLEVATADMSYRPVFTETKRNYTITLVNANNGANVPLEVPYGDTPEYTPKKDPTAQYTYTFDHWAPTFSAVTGPATYTAHWNSVVNNYDIIWKNGDEVLERDENQPYGTATAYNGDTPTKEMDDQYEYTFSKWKSSLDGNLYNDGSTPTVAGETTYEAQYTTTPRYVITFNNYDGTQLARTIYTQGGMPVYEGVPTRKRDADGYFRFIGWKNSDGDDYAANETLPSVTKKETYTAQYDYVTDLFTITLQNVDGNGAEWSGKFGEGSIPFYDPNEDDVPNVPEKAGDAQYSYSFSGWDPALVAVEGEATYTARFEQHVNTYYITFANVDGKGKQQQLEYDYGKTPEYSGVVSMYSDGTYLYSFRAWKQTSDQQEYTTLPKVVGNETYTAQYDVVETLDVNDDITIDENSSLGITTVHVSGKLNVADGVTFTTTNLILEASGDASGQIIEDGTIVAENVYYDLTLNTDARHWHAFGVPWAVDINKNPLTEVETGRTLNISRDYEIMYYDGAERADHGPSAACWKYLRHYDEAGQPVEVLQPGRGYMIAFGSHVNTVRFVKKSDAPIIYTGEVNVTAHQIGAISNPMAYHTTMNAGVGVGQVHDGGEIGHDGYDEVTITEKRFVVGKTVYIDPQLTQLVEISKADGTVSPVAAPARRGAKAMNKKYLTLEDYYTVALINANGEERKVYVLPEEDKEDKYVVGHDLAKMGMSDRKAQIWVNRYEVNLGLNTTAPMDGVAEFPVSVYAPKAGEYTMNLVSEPDEEYTVYLTLNGEAIWNLSSSEYAVELSAGTNKSYGLRLVANKAPQTATGIDEAVVDAQGEIKKVIINDKVFIIRGENVYTIDGQLVK